MKPIFVRVLIFGGILVLLVMLKPNWVQKIPYGQKAVDLRNQVLASQPQLNGLVMSAEQVQWGSLLATIKEQKLPKNPFTGEPKEIKVEDLVTSMGDQLKQLPQDKAKAVKANFCADIVAEAKKQGEVAGANSEQE